MIVLNLTIHIRHASINYNTYEILQNFSKKRANKATHLRAIIAWHLPSTMAIIALIKCAIINFQFFNQVLCSLVLISYNPLISISSMLFIYVIKYLPPKFTSIITTFAFFFLFWIESQMAKEKKKKYRCTTQHLVMVLILLALSYSWIFNLLTK